MYIKKIYLKNFRNYTDQEIELNKGINIFYGENAQGKTNIIESVYLLSTGKSHRTSKDSELIGWGKEGGKVSILFERDGKNEAVEMHLKYNSKKVAKLNGVKLNKIGDLLGNLNTVIFSPDHMKIIKEGPSERRRFIDIILSQVKPGYYYSLVQYIKVLEQRNNLLASCNGNSNALKSIEIWDEQLIRYGARIIADRIDFINKIGKYAAYIHGKITDEKEILKVVYAPSIKIKENSIVENFRKQLNENINIDVKRRNTGRGPHRDDIYFFINDKEVKNFGSQGQQRTTLLSLKLSELQFMNEETDTLPILLLDDVFSELDTRRQNFLMSFIKNIQTFITCTDVEYFRNLNIDDYYLFNVKGGSVTRTF